MNGTDNLVSAFVDAVNRNDEASIAAILHDDFVDHTPNPGQSPGQDGFIEKILQLRSAFPDLVLIVDDVLMDGDRVAFRWTLTGTNDGPFAGGEPSGTAVRFQGVNIERIEHGRIIEHWSVYDAIALFHQLGRLG